MFNLGVLRQSVIVANFNDHHCMVSDRERLLRPSYYETHFFYPSLGLKSSLSQNISTLLNFNVLYSYVFKDLCQVKPNTKQKRGFRNN